MDPVWEPRRALQSCWRLWECCADAESPYAGQSLQHAGGSRVRKDLLRLGLSPPAGITTPQLLLAAGTGRTPLPVHPRNRRGVRCAAVCRAGTRLGEPRLDAAAVMAHNTSAHYLAFRSLAANWFDGEPVIYRLEEVDVVE